MQFLKKYRYFIGGGILLLIIFRFLWIFDTWIIPIYDRVNHSNQLIKLDELPILSFGELPEVEQEKYKKKTCSSVDYTRKKFIKISWFQRYQKVAHNIRIKDLLTPDRLIDNRNRIPQLNKVQ